MMCGQPCYNFKSKVFSRLSQPGDNVVTTIYYNLVVSVWELTSFIIIIIIMKLYSTFTYYGGM